MKYTYLGAEWGNTVASSEGSPVTYTNGVLRVRPTGQKASISKTRQCYGHKSRQQRESFVQF